MAKVNVTTVVRNPTTFESVVLLAGDEVPEWAVVGDHLTSAKAPQPVVQEEPKPQEDAPVVDDETPSDSWTNQRIKQYAEDNSIDLGGATTKADMLAAIGA